MTGSGQRFPQGYTLRGCFVHTQGKAGDAGDDRRLAVAVMVTAAQMGVTPDDTGYFSILINNGRIIDKNLKRMGRDERWLQKQLQQHGAQSVRDVYLLMLNDAGQIYFSAKEPI